ncbi:MAG: branched-chain amino acid ABC transporter permease [Acidobacteria bacterium]|nr:branched-chain amino acid ABC transporter permease [Acidobacteriota bacterium]
MQIIINGLISGLVISLLAVGFNAVYLPTRIFYISLGGIYAVTPFTAWACLQYKIPWGFAFLFSILAALVISMANEFFNHAPLEKRRASAGAHLISSLGIYIIIVQVIAVIWGSETKVLREGIDKAFKFGSLIITKSQLISGIVSVLLIAGFLTWLKTNKLGIRFKALSENPRELALWGFNIKKLRLFAFALSGLFTAAASLLTAYETGFDPYVGMSAFLLAVVATIIGGQESFTGPVIGGILIGLIRAQVVWHFSARWQDAFTFLILVIFLYLRPYGIAGSKVRLENR